MTGTVDAPAFDVRATVIHDGSREEIGTVRLPLPAAGSPSEQGLGLRIME